MAVISKTKVRVGKTQTTLVIKCDSQGIFSAEIPAEVIAALGVREVTGKSKAEVEQNWHEQIRKYIARRTSETKVILYEVRTRPEFSGSRDSGIQLSVCASVFTETTVETESGKTYRYSEIEDAITGDIAQMNSRVVPYAGGTSRADADNRMDWTPEREAFFNRIGQALEAVRSELEKLQDPEKASLIAQNGKLLLPETGKA